MYSESDLINFGEHLLSDERKKRFKESNKEFKKMGMNPLTVNESLKMVHHSDLENWKEVKDRAISEVID